MADRSVTVRLDADVKPFIAAMAKAEAAAKALRDGLGGKMPDPFEPYDKESDKRKRQAPKEGDEIAGAFARAFSKRLDAAFKSLPKAKVDADSSEAQTKLQEVRASLSALSEKRIGIDIDAAAALAEVEDLKAELDKLSESTDIDVRADASAALTQLDLLQRDIDKLAGSNPTVTPEVDPGEALARIAELRASLEDLQRRRQIGVDLDDGAARSAISGIQSELERLNSTSADPKVRLDSAQALAELRTMQAEMSRVDGKSARVKVDADIGGALASIAMVGAALAALPSAVSIGVGVAGLGAAFGVAAAGAAAFGAVAGPSLGRINEALKEQESAAGGAGAATKSAGQAAADAASKSLQLAQAQDRVKDSAQGVKDAQRAVRDAVADVGRAQDDAARAAEDAADRQAQAASRIADAERTVQDAHRATQRAIEDLTRAREAAQERIEDLALATERGALSEERAQISIERAKADLARVNSDPKASSLDKSDADLRLREAELSLKEVQERNGDLAKAREDSDKKGVEGSDEVVAAKQRILDAQRAETDAERSLADARAESAKVARDGAREVADAQSKIADAQRKVADSQQAVIKAQRDQLRATQALKVEQLQQKAALDAAGSAASGAATKMSKLSDAEQALAKKIQTFKDDYVKWQQSLQPDVFPVIEKGLGVLRVGMERATPLVQGGAKGLGLFADAAKKALESKEWVGFFDDLGQRAPDAIAGLGNAAINVAGGLRGVVEAFLPYTDDLTKWVEDITKDFDDWGTNLKDSPEFHDFLEYAKTNGPKVAEIVGNVAKFVGNVASAGAGIGPGVLDFLVGLSEKLGNLDQAQIEALAKGIAAIFAAVKLGASLKIAGLLALADVLSKMSPGQIQAVALAVAAVVAATKGYQAFTAISGALGTFSGKAGAAGKAADTAKGGIGGLSGVLKGGVIAGTVLGMVEAFDKVGDALGGLNPDIAKLTKNLTNFGKDGKASADVIDQIGPKFGGIVGAFETFGDSASRLASDNPVGKFMDGFTGFIDSNLGLQLDSGRQAIDNLDESLAKAVSDGNAEGAAQAFQKLAKQAIDAGTPVEKLKDLFPQYAQAMDGIPATTGGVGQAVELLGGKVDGTQKALGEAAKKLSDFKSSLDIFNGQTDAAATVREMEKAFNDTKTAIEAANGKLELTPGLTGKQRDAVITARDAFSGYVEKVQASADAAFKLTGRTGESTKSVLEQLPKLADLAGKSGEAKAQILLLANAYGISKADAEKAMGSAKGLADVLAKLKSKEIKIGLVMDTSAAEKQFGSFIARYSNKSLGIALAAKVTASGAIRGPGGVDLMAAGGLKPNIADRATFSPGSRSIYAEAGREAFIPYDTSHRARAIKILGKVASDFGLQVYSPQAEQQVKTLSDGLSISTDSITSNLDEATRTLDSTLGSAGSLTQSVSKVGTIGTQLGATWESGSTTVGTAVSTVAKTVDVSTLKIVTSTNKISTSAQAVALAVAKAAATMATAAAKAAAAKPATAPAAAAKSTPAKNTGGSQGAIIGYNPNATDSTGMKPGTYTLPSGMAAGGIKPGIADKATLVPGSTLYGEAGREAYIPYASQHRGRAVSLLGQVASDFGLSMASASSPQLANAATTSAPQRLAPASRASSSSSGPPSGGGASVNFYGTEIRESMDVDVVTAKIGVAIGGRG